MDFDWMFLAFMQLEKNVLKNVFCYFPIFRSYTWKVWNSLTFSLLQPIASAFSRRVSKEKNKLNWYQHLQFWSISTKDKDPVYQRPLAMVCLRSVKPRPAVKPWVEQTSFLLVVEWSAWERSTCADLSFSSSCSVYRKPNGIRMRVDLTLWCRPCVFCHFHVALVSSSWCCGRFSYHV